MSLKSYFLKIALCSGLLLLATTNALKAQKTSPSTSKTRLPIAKPNASTKNVITERRRPDAFAFSPDGKSLIYVEDISRSDDFLSSLSEIWIVNIKDGRAKRLTAGHDDRNPRFGPDGKQIVFTRGKDIWIINADGSDLRNVSNSAVNEESKPEFSHDGQSLFYVCAAPDPLFDDDKENTEDEDQIDAIKYETIVQRNLADGSEKILLQSEYQVLQVVPHPTNNNMVFVLCSPIDAAGKPVDFLQLIDQERTLEKVIVEVPLNGGNPRLFYDSKSQYRIMQMRFAPQRAILVVNTKKDRSDRLVILENGTLKPVPDIVFSGDISRDGKTIAGCAPIDKSGEWSIVLHDITTQKTTPLKITSTTLLASTPLTTVPSTIPSTVQQYLDRGNRHFAAARYDEAIADYSAALEKDPKQAPVLFNRGMARENKKDVKGALADYEAALKINPQYAKPRLQRANLWRAEGRSGEALDEYSEAIKLDPQSAITFFNRGLLYVDRLEVDSAIEDFSTAIGLQPNDAVFYIARGEALSSVGDNQKALDDFAKAIAINPKLSRAYEKRAVLHKAMGNTELAAADELKVKELE